MIEQTPVIAYILNNPRDLGWAETCQLKHALNYAEDLTGGKANNARFWLRKEINKRSGDPILPNFLLNTAL